MKIKLNIIDLFQKSVKNEDYKKLWESNALSLNFFFFPLEIIEFLGGCVN